MERKFLREISIRGMAVYLLHRWWMILAVCVLTGVLQLAVMKEKILEDISQEPEYVLEDGSYVYATLINLKLKPGNRREVPPVTYVELMLSHRSIAAVIEKLELQDSYIDIFHKMTWEYPGDNIKFTISSPFQRVDGHSWAEVLGEIVNQGTSVVMDNYEDIAQMRIIDEPYLENALVTQVQTSDNGIMAGARTVFVACLIGGVLMCAGLLIFYLLREDIMCGEEIEKNLDMPVLAIIDRKKSGFGNVRR